MELLFILKGGDRDETNYGLYYYWNCCDWWLFWTFKASSTDHKTGGRDFNDDASSGIRSDSKGGRCRISRRRIPKRQEYQN